MEFTVGDTSEIFCTTTGLENPVISWSKVSGRLPSNFFAKSNGKLEIKSIKLEDAGRYECSGRQGQTQIKTFIDIIVKRKNILLTSYNRILLKDLY